MLRASRLFRGMEVFVLLVIGESRRLRGLVFMVSLLIERRGGN